MHATIEQLIDYRDKNFQVVETKQHIEQCLVCQEELRALKELQFSLSGLSAENIPEEELAASWQSISIKIPASKSTLKNRHYWVVAACALIVSLGIFSFINLNKGDIKHKQNEQQVQIQDDIKAPQVRNSSNESNFTHMQELLAYSQALENRLQAMPKPKVVRANTAGTISQLEDHISILDSRLNLEHEYPLTENQRNALWQQRVKSMNNLYQVRNAQLQRVTY